MKLVCIMALCLLIPILIKAEGEFGSVKGRVLTSDGQPAEFVNIHLKGENKGTVTDSEGYYKIKNLRSGSYTLVASFVGSVTQEKNFTVSTGSVAEVDFTLSEKAQQLSEVVITHKQSLNERTASIGKISINPMDLPQSVMIINRDVIDQQQVLRLSDALMNANGVYVMGTTGGTQEELAGRGFAYNSNNTFKNGVRFNNGVMPETSSLERLEILKGSNAILFGNVAAGGIINLVTKKPKFENGGELTMRLGSYQFYKPSIDIYGAINDSQIAAYRVNASYENSGSFRDNVKSERFYINPSFLFKAGKKTEILIEGDYLNDKRTSDFGIGAINYAIANVPRNAFLGAKWSSNLTQQKNITLTATHQLNKKWQMRVIGSAYNYNNELFGTVRPNSNSQFIQADGKWIRGLQRTGTIEDYNLVQFDLTGSFTTGLVKHSFLAGADADAYFTNTTAYNNLAKYDSINIFDLNLYEQHTDIPTLTKRTLTKAPVKRAGVYIQDLISITEKIKILAGIRYSYFDRESTVLTYSNGTTAKTNYNDGAFTPRFGLIYQPTTKTSLFASYANSFVLNQGIDIYSKPLMPSFVDQFEVGMKNELFKGLISANVTAYQIVNSNQVQSVIIPAGNPNNIPANAQELAGEVTSKGIEVDVMSRSYHGFSLITGYSFNRTSYTKSNIYENGSLLRYNPAHTSNLSIYYAFSSKSILNGLNFGFTSLYIGDRMAGRNTRLTVTNDSYKMFPVPSYFQLDLSAGYRIERISLRLKVSNVLNKLSYNVHDDNSINPIAPRQLSVTISYKL